MRIIGLRQHDGFGRFQPFVIEDIRSDHGHHLLGMGVSVCAGKYTRNSVPETPLSLVTSTKPPLLLAVVQTVASPSLLPLPDFVFPDGECPRSGRLCWSMSVTTRGGRPQSLHPRQPADIKQTRLSCATASAVALD